MSHAVSSLRVGVRGLLLSTAAASSLGNAELGRCSALVAVVLLSSGRALGFVRYHSVLLCNRQQPEAQGGEPKSLFHLILCVDTDVIETVKTQQREDYPAGRCSIRMQLFKKLGGGHVDRMTVLQWRELRLNLSVLTNDTVFRMEMPDLVRERAALERCCPRNNSEDVRTAATKAAVLQSAFY